eukprot:jgi/Phyca11/104237/e_gw1.9.398.1
MHWCSESTAPATSTAMLRASDSPSNVSTENRKVRLSDRELLHCVQSVSVPDEPIDLRGISSRHGWKHVRVGVSGDMKMYSKTQTQQYQVLVGGEIRAQVSELLSLLRASTESESNALMQALFGSQFIYSSLVHAVAFSERGSLESAISRGSAIAAGPTGQQLMVRTASFARSRVGNPFKCRSSTSMKNDQICYAELLTPTQEGFQILYRTIDEADVATGKAPPGNAITLHPLTGWLTVEPTRTDPDKVRFTFQAVFDGTEADVHDFQVAQTRLRFIGKGVCRIEKVLRRRQRKRYQLYVTPGWLWLAILKPFRALGVLREESTRQNWHCIACTRSFFPTLSKQWRRCDLCSYRICANSPCCSHERVAIYNRYVVSLSVCARCRECIDERDGDHRGSVHRVGGLSGDLRYTGLSL